MFLTPGRVGAWAEYGDEPRPYGLGSTPGVSVPYARNDDAPRAALTSEGPRQGLQTPVSDIVG